MAPMDITVGQLIDQVERDLPDADPVAEGRRGAPAREDPRRRRRPAHRPLRPGRPAGRGVVEPDRRRDGRLQAGGPAAGGRRRRQVRAVHRPRPHGRRRRPGAGARPAAPERRAGARAGRAAGGARRARREDHRGVRRRRGRPGRPGAGDPAPAGDGERVDHVPFSAASKAVLEQTGQAAIDLLNNYVGTEHILLGLLAVPDSAAARTLVDAGIDQKRARDMVAAALMGWQESTQKGALPATELGLAGQAGRPGRPRSARRARRPGRRPAPGRGCTRCSRSGGR